VKNNITNNTLGINVKTVIICSGIFLLLSAATIFIHLSIYRSHHPAVATPSTSGTSADEPAAMDLIRGNDLKLINKLYLADIDEESPKYLGFKGRLSGIITKAATGPVKSVSVYFRNMTDGSWMSIGSDNLFYPGSLIKVPIMIYFLEQERLHKGTLDKVLTYEKPKQSFPSQVYKGDSILDGRKYKISELLKYMIVESDNNATNLLAKNMKNDPFCKIFTDLEIPPDKINDVNYQISAKDYSKFFRILYSSSYLPRTYSEYALELLAKCKFNQGISRNLPQDIIVAHKFGEHGRDYDMDFSETAIVYHPNVPYLLAIMTKGSDAKIQSDVVSNIADEVYRFVSGNSSR
jgi:beta-lactamase class A